MFMYVSAVPLKILWPKAPFTCIDTSKDRIRKLMLEPSIAFGDAWPQIWFTPSVS